MTCGFCVWIVTDSAELGRKWLNCLTFQSWNAHWVHDLSELEAAASKRHCDFCLTLLDISGVGNRREISEHLHKCKKNLSLIVFSSAAPVSDKDVAILLENGFDDYVDVRMDCRLLVAKLCAHLRRGLPVISDSLNKRVSCSGRVQLDLSSGSVALRPGGGAHGETRQLTPVECEILSVLLAKEGTVVDRGQLMEYVWQGRTVNPENIDKHIEFLRKKLGGLGGNIKTVYGRGYCYMEGENEDIDR